MKRQLVLFLFLFVGLRVMAQPIGYYDAANGLTGDRLKVALHEIIKDHTTISYAQLWNAFWSTDNKGDGVVWDMYSDIPGGTSPYVYYLGMDQCGSGGCNNVEGTCYNREHSWPQSWFSEQSTPRTDLHHIFPTDCQVNHDRGNNPYGEVSSGTTFKNGSKLGPCKTLGYSGTVFEPIDEYKGDFARAYFYMSVRYYSEDGSWKSSPMTDKSEIKPWAMAMLLRWNKLDPVSQKEIDRNNAIYDDYQRNRNPFVDYPEYADMIWDPNWSVVVLCDETPLAVYPNPVQQGGTLRFSTALDFDQLVVGDLSGRILARMELKPQSNTCDLPRDLKPGCYLLQLFRDGRSAGRAKILVN